MNTVFFAHQFYMLSYVFKKAGNAIYSASHFFRLSYSYFSLLERPLVEVPALLAFKIQLLFKPKWILSNY